MTINMDNCLFCKIIKKEIPAEFVHESDTVVAFADLHPRADKHILIVPKKHIASIKDLNSDHGILLSEIFRVVNLLAEDYNLVDDHFRVAVNGGKAQTVPHLHFHFLGGNWKKMI